MKVVGTDFKIPGGRTIGFALGAMIYAGSACAQNAPSSCVSDLQKEYASNAALRSECTKDDDCSFQAPEGNASALALIGAMVKRTESCFATAGLTVSKEDTVPEGTTRYYGTARIAEKCALLIATGAGGVARGMRAACQ